MSQPPRPPRDAARGDGEQRPPETGDEQPPATGADERLPRPVRPARPARPGRAAPAALGAGRARHASPPTPGGGPRRVARVLSWVAVVTSVAVLVSAGAGFALLNKYDGNIERINGLLDMAGMDRPPDGTAESQTFLLVGSDSRAGLAAGEGVQGQGEEFVAGQRADTVILAHLFADSDQAQLVSIPRDSWVTIPEFEDPRTGRTVPEHPAKINSAFFDGGPALLVAAVERLSGVRVDHYVQVDFDGFRTMVDRLGGVEVCLSAPAKEKDSGIDLPAGRQTIDGQQALAFVRQRKGLPQGDIDRIRRQQQFMGAMIRKTLSAGTLLNPLKVNGFLEAATDSLQVNEGLQIGDLRDLALRMRGASAGQVAFTTVPVADPAARREGQSVVLLDEAATAALFDRIRRDVPPGEADPDEPAGPGPGEPAVAPADVRVAVLNGAGIAGLGGRAAAELSALGFEVVGPPRDRGSSATVTVVRHGVGQQAQARTLAAALPGAVVQEVASLGSVLEVVVGSSYAGVGGPGPADPGATGAPPPASAAPVTTAADDVCAP